VKHLSMLVTSDGQWVLEDSTEFLAVLGDPHPDYDAASFAVKNLGFIKFQVHDSSIVEIELHPRNVQLPALLAVQQQLLSSQVRLFRIKYFDTTWHSEIMTASEPAITRLSELCAPAFEPSVTERFLVERRDYSALFTDAASPLRFMAQKWRMSLGYFDPSVIPFAIKHQLFSLMAIAGIKARGGDPVFRFIGDGFKWMETGYQFNGIGERIENLPDKEYGGWLSEFYKSVATSGQPRYEIVTAAIQTDLGKRKPYLTRYERLLLPWKTRSDEIFVSLSSKKLIDMDDAETEDSEWSSLSRDSAKSA
jgi:hypothetical protein